MDNTEQTLQILSNATGTNTELLNIKLSSGVGDIVVQLDVFKEKNENCTATGRYSITSINLNSHHEIFQAIMHQVTDTPHEMKFLSVLQHLLRMNPNEELSGVIWTVVEKLVHLATQLENSAEAEQLLNLSITQKFACQNDKIVKSDKGTKLVLHSTIDSLQKSPIATVYNFKFLPPPSFHFLPLPPTPPPLPAAAILLPPPNEISPPNNLLLPQQYIPKSSRKLKTLNWIKIPLQKIIKKSNIWTTLANNCKYKCIELIDFKSIEGLFCVQNTNINKNKDEIDGTGSGAKKKKIFKNIHLLNSQSSLKINIFLSQFKGYKPEDIVQLIRTGDHKTMNLEKLKDLKRFFQNDNEIKLLKNFKGDRQRLASAEKFLISVMEVPNFELRIESMILKEEFALNIKYLEPSLYSIIQAGNDLMRCKTLQEILGIVIIIGNFLNSGGYAGNAAGIKLSSLKKLNEIKANKTGMHLMHLIAMEVERYNPELLHLNNELSFLESVSKLSSYQIEKDIKDMEFALKIVKKQINMPSTEEKIKQQMNKFIKEADEKMSVLNKKIEELNSLRAVMADFFCEDFITFKMEEYFQTFHTFSQQFQRALEENRQRRQIEMQANMRRKQKEQQLATIAVQTSTMSPKRLNSKDSNKKFRRTEIHNTIFDIVSKRDEDDLITFLQTSNLKCNRGKENIRKPRFNKRPDLLKFNFGREREDYSNILPGSDNKHFLPSKNKIIKTQPLDEPKKTINDQKSWEPLTQSFKASQLETKCLTQDTPPRHESLQIFIRSNSTVDNRSGQVKKQPAVVSTVRTPFSETGSMFNFSPNEIQTRQNTTENLNTTDSTNSLNKTPISIKASKDFKETPSGGNTTLTVVEKNRPRISLKTMANIVQIGSRYSSINEEDLKTKIKKLRTPTLEQSKFCFSPIQDSPPRNSLALNPTFSENNNNSNENHVFEILNDIVEDKTIESVECENKNIFRD